MDAHGAFDWTLVRSFLAVLDAGSLMGAARALGARQPTLSRHVAELEARLGAVLFERTGRGVTPTAAALAIAEAARRMEADASDLLRAAGGLREATTGTVRITASEIAAAYLLPPVLARLQREVPGVQLELHVSNQVSNLLRREADIAVRMVRPNQRSLIARKLGVVRILACAHQSYLARAGVPRSIDDLLRHRLIGYDRDVAILRGFARFGVTLSPSHFAVRTDNQLAYGQLVAAGVGVGFVGHYCLPHWPGVEEILPSLRIPPLPCWLTVHREIRSSKLVRKVYDFLAEHVRGALA
ncbi:MAG: LysR family transcriptional regulator [Kofleriaceae bacterium]